MPTYHPAEIEPRWQQFWATNKTFRRVRARSVKAPYGPSSTTLVPMFNESIRALSSPSALTVSRSEVSSTPETENGWARCHQPDVRKRTVTN